MLPDAATVARHPALAEFRLMELEARCATLEAALQRQFAAPMPPEHITDTDVARVYRRVYGGPRFGSTEREFAEEIARLRDDQWKASLVGVLALACNPTPEPAPPGGFRFSGAAEMQRVTPAEPFNPDPDARYRRTLAEAFPCDARQAVAFFDVSRPPRYGRWLALVLGLLVVLAMAGCSQAGAQEPQPMPEEQRIARAAARACQGLTPVWQDDGSHICLKERP